MKDRLKEIRMKEFMMSTTDFSKMNEDLPFIFERLYRGDKSRNKIEVSGIGLTIVQNILTLLLKMQDMKWLK